MTTNTVLQQYGTQLLFADHATDFGAAPATAANSLIIGTPTDVQMNLSVLADTAMWQSAKTAILAHNVGVNNDWPIEWVFGACMEAAATPAAGVTFDFFWNASPSATVGTGNSGGCSGVDATYTAAGTDQLIPLGSLVCRNNVINIDSAISIVTLPHLYGSLVIQNKSGVGMVDTVADEIHFTLTPLIPTIQAAV